MTRGLRIDARGWLALPAVAIIVGLGAATAQSSGTPVTRTFNVVIAYTGEYHELYTNGGFTVAVSLTFDESRPVELKFGGGAYLQGTEGPVSLGATGTITSSKPGDPNFMPDNCTISAAGTSSVNLGVMSGDEKITGGSAKDTVNVGAGLPQSVGNGGQLTVSGTNNNCFFDTTEGAEVAPYDFMNPPPGGFQGGASYNAAQLPTATGVDVSKLPFSQSFPVDFTQTDSTGGTDHVTISDTLSITGLCSAGASAIANRLGVAASQSSCCQSSAAGAAAAGAGGLRVIGGPREAGGFPYTFSSFKLKLSADAGGGCPKYHFTWRLVDSPARDRVSVKRGVKVTVLPESAGPQTRQSTATQEIKLTCSIPRALRRRLSISPRNPTLTPCRGSVRYTVDVTDSGPGPKTGSATINLYWDPKCISSDIRRALERKRHQIADEIHQDLLTKGFKAIGTRGIEGLLEAETLGPYLLAHELAEAVLDYAKLQQEYDRLTNELSEPNC